MNLSRFFIDRPIAAVVLSALIVIAGALSLGRLPLTGGNENKQANVTASGGARGVDPEKDSKGGENPEIVVVTLAAADIAAFKKAGGLP